MALPEPRQAIDNRRRIGEGLFVPDRTIFEDVR